MNKKIYIETLIALLVKEQSRGAKSVLLEGSITSLVETDTTKEVLVTSVGETNSDEVSAYVEKSKIIQKIADELEKSTKTTWTRSGIDDWSDHANKMKNVIRTSLPILRVL